MGLKASEKRTVILASIHFFHVIQKHERCTLRSRIDRIGWSLLSLRHSSGAASNSICSVRTDKPLATPGLTSLHSWPHPEHSACTWFARSCHQTVCFEKKDSLLQLLSHSYQNSSTKYHFNKH